MDRLRELLDLEPAGRDRYLAITPAEGPPRLFGGQVAAQSLRAATLTVDASRPPHSMHAYFIRPGRPGTPLELTVERTRDGRSFTTRHVTAAQNAEPIFMLSASFHAGEEGDDWQLPGPSGLPDPEDLDPPDSMFARFSTMSPFDMRPVHKSAPGEWPMRHPMWVRALGDLGDDPAVHICVITFMSDMGVVGSVRSPVSARPMEFMGASLDHAVWFHRPARADEWLLFSVDPVTNASARGLARGTFHRRDGVLVASIAQEALLRATGPLPDSFRA